MPIINLSFDSFLFIRTIFCFILIHVTSGPSQGLKIRGACSTVVGIICPPGWDRVNCLAKNWSLATGLTIHTISAQSSRVQIKCTKALLSNLYIVLYEQINVIQCVWFMIFSSLLQADGSNCICHNNTMSDIDTCVGRRFPKGPFINYIDIIIEFFLI